MIPDGFLPKDWRDAPDEREKAIEAAVQRQVDSIYLCDACRRGVHAEHRYGSCECGYCPDDQPFERSEEDMR